MNSTAMEQRAKYTCWGVWAARTRSSSSGSAAAPSPSMPWAAAAYGGGEPSWEEQAFARDAAASLGGSVWPPRSYSCSFCQREFRSAQALGGHMNVHRRDRARLRQCSSPDEAGEAAAPPHGGHDHHHQPHQAADTFLYKAISNPSTTTPPPSSTPSPSYISTIIRESKSKVLLSMAAVREDGAIFDHSDNGDDDEEECLRSTKRRRVAEDQQPLVALPIFVIPAAAAVAPMAMDMVAPIEEEENKLLISQQGDVDHREVHKTTASPSSSSAQEVDLELRLGTTPKVT